MSTGLVIGVLLACGTGVLLSSSGRSRATLRSRSVEGRRGVGDAPLILDLLAAMLSSGAAVESALALVADSCDPQLGVCLTRVHGARRLGASWDSSWEVGRAQWYAQREAVRAAAGIFRVRRLDGGAGVIEDLRQGLRFATSTGAPSAALLHAHAAQLRRRRNREVHRRAAALGVQLVLPLGLCSLPAFICLGVVPVVLGLLPAL
jgi:hypothetical protein